jgi:hypothetical protein
MTGELDQILTGVTARGGKRDVETAIDGLSSRSLEGREAGFSWWGGAESLDDCGGDVEGTFARQPHHGDGRAAGRGGKGGDGVGEHRARCQVWFSCLTPET